jgi:HlyD family secretion protein
LAETNNTPKAGGRGWLWIVIILVVVALIILLSRKGPIHVRTTRVERGPIRSLISTNGKVEPIQNFEAHAPIATTVKRILVKEGDHVRKGQLLLQLDDADIRSQLARASAQLKAAEADESALHAGGIQEEVLTTEAQLTKARSARDTAQRNLDSLQRLSQQGAASAAEVRQAQDVLDRARADLTLLEQKQKKRYSAPEAAKVEASVAEAREAYSAAADALAKSNVRAPFDGVVYALPARQASFVQTGDLLLQEADLSKVLVRTFVDEPDIARLAAGQRIEITWDAIPGRVWNGSVSSVPSTVKHNGARNVGEVTCILDNHDLKLLPNVNVGVSIIIAQHENVLTVLREAVHMDDSKPYVYEVVDGTLKRRDLDVSLQNLTRVEVAHGVSENAVIALGSQDPRPLADGASVKAIE